MSEYDTAPAAPEFDREHRDELVRKVGRALDVPAELLESDIEPPRHGYWGAWLQREWR